LKRVRRSPPAVLIHANICYGSDGQVRLVIENVTRGYRRTFELGAL
jgi:hypothetical protein